jgi:prepilin peptidase CpaA
MPPGVLVVAIGVLGLIAYGDVRTRRIPNELSLAIAALGLMRILLVDDPAAAGHTLAAGAAVFVAAFLLFWWGAIGGGDGKLVAAMALLIGYRNLFEFLFLMSVCGGALALTIVARDQLAPRLRQRARISPSTKITAHIAAPTNTTVPYGVAVAAAGIVMLVLETSFTR